MRRPMVAGNWKMNKTSAEAVKLAEELKPLLADVKGVDIVLCPPFTSLEELMRPSEVLICFWVHKICSGKKAGPTPERSRRRCS